MTEDDCLACRLATEGPPGGTIYSAQHWTVEHCIGPLRVGTLIVKPLRHVTTFASLTPEEAAEFGPLLHAVTQVLIAELGPDQTYICEWSHAGWVAGHIHFVVQPAWNADADQFARPGPFLQTTMFEASQPLDAAEVTAFCDRLRRRLSDSSRGFPASETPASVTTGHPPPAQRERGRG